MKVVVGLRLVVVDCVWLVTVVVVDCVWLVAVVVVGFVSVNSVVVAVMSHVVAVELVCLVLATVGESVNFV